MTVITGTACDDGRDRVHHTSRRIAHRLSRDFDHGGWRKRAACTTLPTELFFPVGEQGPEALAQIAEAKRVCSQCSTVDECLIYAVSTHQDHGIFGGQTSDERRRIKRRLKYMRTHA